MTFIYGHRTIIVETRRWTEDGKGEMGSFVRSWGGLLCTWPTCWTPAVTREGIERPSHASSILTSNRIGSTLDFPYSRWNFASQSLSLSLSLSLDLPTRSRAREKEKERKKESRCAEKEDLSRRDVVLTSVSRRRGPRDLDNRSRRARQGRVTVHRMKVTRIIHGPVFLFSKIERRPRGISPIGNLDLVSPFIFRSRGYAKKGKSFGASFHEYYTPSLWKLGDERIRGFFFSGPVPVNVAQKEGGGGEERRG